MVRRRLLVAVVALVAGGAVLAQAGSSARGQEGGILKIGVSAQVPVGYVDPALSFGPAAWALLEATCARLYTYPDKASPASFRVRPEVAARYTRSEDLKRYTFTLRRGFRFSNGEPVRASAFARAINRVLSPVMASPGAMFMRDIVGADDVLSGKTEKARGVVARGNTLVVRFKRPAPNFVARTTYPFFCAVPPWLRVSAEGVGKVPSAGPYYVEDFRPAEGIKVRRNRFYGGERKVHLDGFNVDLRGGNPVELLRSIDRGDADWGHMFAGVFSGLGFEKYASRFHLRPGLTLRLLVFNSSRPLFRDNLRLRQAVNFALDRRALEVYGPELSQTTDQLLPHSVLGFRDAHIYPLGGNLERAQELARGQLRDRKAVFHITTFGPLQVQAQLIKEQLARIGLEVEVRSEPPGFMPAYFAQLTSPVAEWDMAFLIWAPNIPDAHEYLSLLLETQRLGGEDATRRWKLASAALARAARLPPGRARNLAFAGVDAMITRDVAPAAALSVLKEATFVTERVGCRVLRPALDLAVACLKD